ncbi:hypothetical protein GCM10017771_60260 [Streptomyces capitiformicae]|uniref:Uncharacterized protein n=1 Tax=Streptomyces capitiformicae TaxID=2014920 RepID=A0A918Z834_9ACTN|nr:hypothetical protein GCM10017771_60260 [Streptomyces capitiformicae]
MVSVRFSPLKDTNPEIRTGLSTSPAPGPSPTNSFLMSGVITLEARRMPTADASTTLPRSHGGGFLLSVGRVVLVA